MITIDYPFKKEILACGTKEWSGICLTKKNYGYVLNELKKENNESYLEYYEREIDRLKGELKVRPKIVVHDLFSEYLTSKYAKNLTQENKDLKCVAVQHHHAHIASCIAENKIKDKVIAVVLDNSGYGEDGNFWGGEIFVGTLKGLKRQAHFSYIPIIKSGRLFLDSWSLAASFLYCAFGEKFIELDIEFIRKRQPNDWQQLQQSYSGSALYSSSAGSLFDAVAALVGLQDSVDYEGQGAMSLERIVNKSSHAAHRIYEFTIKKDKDIYLIKTEPTFLNIIEDLKNNISKSIISTAFHNTIMEILKDVCDKISRKEKTKNIVLTGSVFQNKYLLSGLLGLLQEQGFNVITHKHFTYNDNGIAFGQAVMADIKS